MGPTASGKSELAESLAEEFRAELVSADAFQVYRGFDIGTAKPANRERYHLIDVHEPTESFGAGEFVVRTLEILQSAYERNVPVVVVGGTGLYIRALFEEYRDLAPTPPSGLRAALNERFLTSGLQPLIDELLARDPAATSRVDLKNPRRVLRALERLSADQSAIQFVLPPFRKIKVALQVEPERLDASISARLRAMMQGGFVEEVERILNRGVPEDAPAMDAIGYRTLTSVVKGDLDLESAFEEIVLETRRYAKRQRTWLRSEPELNWIDHEALRGRIESVRSIWNE